MPRLSNKQKSSLLAWIKEQDVNLYIRASSFKSASLAATKALNFAVSPAHISAAFKLLSEELLWQGRGKQLDFEDRAYGWQTWGKIDRSIRRIAETILTHNMATKPDAVCRCLMDRGEHYCVPAVSEMLSLIGKTGLTLQAERNAKAKGLGEQCDLLRT